MRKVTSVAAPSHGSVQLISVATLVSHFALGALSADDATWELFKRRELASEGCDLSSYAFAAHDGERFGKASAKVETEAAIQSLWKLLMRMAWLQRRSCPRR